MDLTGIKNENEFYSQHYLSSILEQDLKDLFRQWEQEGKEQGITPPYKRLGSLRREFFTMKNRLQRERDLSERLSLQRKFAFSLLRALGYSPDLLYLPVDAEGEECQIPALSAIQEQDGSPLLWVMEAFDPEGESADPLTLGLHPAQYQEGTSFPKALEDMSLERIVSRMVFSLDEPPRWLLILSDAQLILMDRGKWNRKSLLRFDLSEILGRNETSTLKAAAALIHRESLCPGSGAALLDRIDENSHKHAFSVSEDLKFALREAIELIGNEAVWYLRERLHEKVYGKGLAEELTIQCLRYMYRLLFIFYIEARPELEYAPIKSEVYRKGYSLESLRDLEMVRLVSEEDKNGYFIHDSLSLLFELIHRGFPPEERNQELRQQVMDQAPVHNTFTIQSLRSHLFDPARTPLLNRVKFRNHVLQRVIRFMSLTRPGKGRNKRRGRVSYAQLGINQLGAVYEALLSYRGFFAETDLYEVKREKDHYNELETAYFVKEEDLEHYSDSQKVFNPDGTLKKYEKGTFIYRLAGRDRQMSASYYTPEVLTRALVKYALKELLQGKSADEILEVTVCEPAMGSAAFLNETVSQLAEAYLEKKQKELGEQLPHDSYQRELQKVKMFIADNNVFGIDLNPVAVELAEVSLWLNTIYRGAFVPWFGLQLVCGNSLIGARRQVFEKRLITKRKRGESSWLDMVPERIAPGDERPKDAIYHFFLPDKAMADYRDRVIKNEIAPEETRKIAKWRRTFINPPFSQEEAELMVRLSDAFDRLYEQHVKKLKDLRIKTTDTIALYGRDRRRDTKKRPTSTSWKDQQLEEMLLSRGQGTSSPYLRLKAAMDYWCSLWFWPIEKAGLLPTRRQFLEEMAIILLGQEGVTLFGQKNGQKELFLCQEDALGLLSSTEQEYGLVELDALFEKSPRLRLVQELSGRYRFLHWELEFADIFHDRGGFDLILGNPPWIKVEWNEGGVMGDAEPLFVLKGYSASRLARLRKEVMEKYDLKSTYLSAYESTAATQNFLNALQNYPVLEGQKANLFKCFLPQAWWIGTKESVSAFLHPEGIYDDPKGGRFRQEVYKRLRYHFQFQNELHLFSEVDHHAKFSINVYSNSQGACAEDQAKNSEPLHAGTVSFSHIANLFTPKTIDACFSHHGFGPVPGIKNRENKWETEGHRDRIIHVTEKELSLFARLYDEEGTPALEARLPAIHSRQLISVLEKFAAQPRRLGDLEGEYFCTQHWNETNAQRDGTIRRETRFPDRPSELILSGPHFFVGTPLYKTPRRKCTQNSHYDILDLTTLPDDYLPRTNYVPAVDMDEYMRRTPKVPWGDRKPVTEFYRFVNRRRFGGSSERSLICAVMPPGVGHVHPVLSTTFNNAFAMFNFVAMAFSVIFDFFLKTTGKSDIYESTLKRLPILDSKNIRPFTSRALSLTCLTTHYAALWAECWDPAFTTDHWTKDDPRLPNEFFKNLTFTWNRNCALRTDYARRQALVEIDVLAAMALGLTLEELKTIYRVQFPVLRMYEQDTWYDQGGRIVFTCSKGLAGVGFPRPEWNKIKDMKSGTVERTIEDDTLPGGPRERTIVYHAPFDRCDRERDYEIAWAEFEKRLKQT